MPEPEKLNSSSEFAVGAGMVVIAIVMILQSYLFAGDRLSEAGQALVALW